MVEINRAETAHKKSISIEEVHTCLKTLNITVLQSFKLIIGVIALYCTLAVFFHIKEDLRKVS